MDKSKKDKLHKYTKNQKVVYSLIWESTSFKRELTGKNEILVRDLKYRNHNLIFVTIKINKEGYNGVTGGIKRNEKFDRNNRKLWKIH